MCFLCQLGAGFHAVEADGGDPSPGDAPPVTPTLIEQTDAAASTATTFALSTGQTIQGTLGGLGDHDWFRVNLVAGQTYTFAMVGSGSNNVEDTYLRLRNASGVEIAFNDDGLPGRNSIIVFTASQSGTYYIDAGAWNEAGTGQYGVSFTAGNLASFDTPMGGGVMDVDTRWTSMPVSVGFRSSNDFEEANFSRFSAAQMAVVQTVLQIYDDVSGLEFNIVNNGGYTDNATILLSNYSDGDGSGGYAQYPGSADPTSQAGNVHINLAGGSSTTSLPAGSYSFWVILHELGHALGLSHPGLYNAGAGVPVTYGNHAQFIQDTHQFTVMSYFDESNSGASFYGYPQTLMLFDIYALQQIYGVDLTARPGNTVYGFNSNAGGVYDFSTNPDPALCIWDGGGIDTLDCSGFTQNQFIQIAEGSFSDVGGWLANVSIALGAKIENAYGGSGNDTVNGNELDNVLRGNGGNDTLNGSSGNDTLIGGAGVDKLFGGVGNDTIYWDPNDDLANVLGGGDFDTLVFTSGSAPTSFNLVAHQFERALGILTDAGSQPWSIITDTYNTAWQLLTQDGVYDNGGSWHTDFDVANAFWYRDVTDFLNAADQLLYTNYFRDTGELVNQAFDYNSSQWWSYFTNYFTAGGALTNTDGVADDNRYWSAAYDTADSQWWDYFTLWYDTQNPATRRLINEEGIADDGRRWTTTYDVDNDHAWTTQTVWFNSGGDIIDVITT